MIFLSNMTKFRVMDFVSCSNRDEPIKSVSHFKKTLKIIENFSLIGGHGHNWMSDKLCGWNYIHTGVNRFYFPCQCPYLPNYERNQCSFILSQIHIKYISWSHNWFPYRGNCLPNILSFSELSGSLLPVGPCRPASAAPNLSHHSPFFTPLTFKAGWSTPPTPSD